MKILITSGGTTENIDAVRGITNHATGTLGKEVAECFLAQGHDDIGDDTKSGQTQETFQAQNHLGRNGG